jgi:hypothetical protein
MSDLGGDLCDCRLCDWTGAGWVSLDLHLTTVHSLPIRLGNDATLKLHAAKDYQDRSENTLGLYDPEERLLAVIVMITVRAADDPMGWEHLP